MEQLVEWELVGETEVFGGYQPQCHFIHHKFHFTWPRIEHGPPRWEGYDKLQGHEQIDIQIVKTDSDKTALC
jgi:hypothetical protein